MLTLEFVWTIVNSVDCNLCFAHIRISQEAFLIVSKKIIGRSNDSYDDYRNVCG